MAIVPETGDETMVWLTQVAHKEGITAAQFTAIGAFASATLGYFDWQTKEYQRNPVAEQVEVESLTGDIALGTEASPCCISIACSGAATARRSPAI
jgi:predicted DNA-binding protein with PD1-like motif